MGPIRGAHSARWPRLWHLREGRVNVTIDEQTTLARIEGKVDDIDTRLRTVETTIGSFAAVDAERLRNAQRSGDSQRWIVTLAITTGLSLAGLIVAVLKVV